MTAGAAKSPSDAVTLTYSAADTAFIAAHFPAVTIEKWMGCASVPGCYSPAAGAGAAPACPTQEDATLATARLLKAAAPAISVVTWTDSMRIYSQPSLNPSIENKGDQDCVRNAATPFLEAHPAYLLKNATGGLARLCVDPCLAAVKLPQKTRHVQFGRPRAERVQRILEYKEPGPPPL